MYSQYIPHFPTLWLTKDERPLLYKYFILNPSLCRISSIVSSHLRILYIVPKSADLGTGHVLARSPAASVTAALLLGEPKDVPSGVSSAGRGLPQPHQAAFGEPEGSSSEAGAGNIHPSPLLLPLGVRTGGSARRRRLRLLSALDLGENESKNASSLSKLSCHLVSGWNCQQARLDNLT